MPKPTTTELQWKLDALERKVVALTDLIAFMLAHLGLPPETRLIDTPIRSPMMRRPGRRWSVEVAS